MGPPWAAAGGACALWVAPQAPLWSSGVFLRIKNLRKLPGNSDDISYGALSEIQNRQKQETGTGHLVNRLAQQNA